MPPQHRFSAHIHATSQRVNAKDEHIRLLLAFPIPPVSRAINGHGAGFVESARNAHTWNETAKEKHNCDAVNIFTE